MQPVPNCPPALRPQWLHIQRASEKRESNKTGAHAEESEIGEMLVMDGRHGGLTGTPSMRGTYIHSIPSHEVIPSPLSRLIFAMSAYIPDPACKGGLKKKGNQHGATPAPTVFQLDLVKDPHIIAS